MPTETRQPGQHKSWSGLACRVQGESMFHNCGNMDPATLLGLLGPTNMEEGNSKHMDCRRVEPRFLLHQHVSYS